MKKIYLILALVATSFCACEKGEYWEHPTPANPVIAHLMCVKITKAPNGYTYGVALSNYETEVLSARFDIHAFAPDTLPAKFYTKGGQRLDKDAFVLTIVGINNSLSDTIVYADIVPQFRDGRMVYKGDTIGLPTEYVFSNGTYSGKYYFRYD